MNDGVVGWKSLRHQLKPRVHYRSPVLANVLVLTDSFAMPPSATSIEERQPVLLPCGGWDTHHHIFERRSTFRVENSFRDLIINNKTR